MATNALRCNICGATLPPTALVADVVAHWNEAPGHSYEEDIWTRVQERGSSVPKETK